MLEEGRSEAKEDHKQDHKLTQSAAGRQTVACSRLQKEHYREMPKSPRLRRHFCGVLNQRQEAKEEIFW